LARSSSKKTSWVQSPVPFDEQIRGFRILQDREPGWEWVYYSQEQFAAILATFRPRAGDKFDRGAFGRTLHTTITDFRREVDCEREKLAPSEVERACAQVASQARLLLASLEPVEGALLRAAQDLAAQGAPPPDCQSKKLDATDRYGCEVAPTTYWPVEKNLRGFREMLAWLPQCAQAAAEQAGQEKANPGNRSADSVDNVVASLHKLFCENSAEKVTAHKDRINGDVVHGNMIDFLEACLRPLGCKDSRASLLRRFEKAKHVEKAKHEDRLIL
jgi:hypothetical protein